MKYFCDVQLLAGMLGLGGWLGQTECISVVVLCLQPFTAIRQSFICMALLLFSISDFADACHLSGFRLIILLL